MFLERYELSEAKTSAKQADAHVKLTKDDEASKPLDQVNYQSMVDSLLRQQDLHNVAHKVEAVLKFKSCPI